jgi:hypothetical protein
VSAYHTALFEVFFEYFSPFFQSKNVEVLSFITIPNVLLNSACAPSLSEIDAKGEFAVGIDTKLLNDSQVGFIFGDWESQRVISWSYLFQ